MKNGQGIDELRLVNGLLGDPAVFAFFPKMGEAILFDLGDLTPMSSRDLLRVSVALVSHTHIDHFIGFDRLLRVHVPHFHRLEIAGPPGIIANVKGKLDSYLWNLLEPKQVSFIVHEITPMGSLYSAILENSNNFAPVPYERAAPKRLKLDPPWPTAPAVFVTTLADGTRIEATALDHGTPSIAYVCQSPCRFHVKIDMLQQLGLYPGPWIRDLQIALANGDHDLKLEISGKSFSSGELGAMIFECRVAKPLGYLTDLGFTAHNLQRTRQLFQGVEVLVCEANYQDNEFAKAKTKKHLTTRQAALIAAYAGAKKLQIFHVSNIYVKNAESSVKEAENYFAAYAALDPEALQKEIDKELAR